MVISISIPTTFREVADIASAASSNAMDYAKKNPVTVTGIAAGILFTGSLAGWLIRPPKNGRDVAVFAGAHLSSYALAATALIWNEQQATDKR